MSVFLYTPLAGDVLGGHLDDVEKDMAQPIVSVSLGCPAIFLMGGPVKHVAPTALLLRGGDVVVLAGEARRCYHGEIDRASVGTAMLALSAAAAGSGWERVSLVPPLGWVWACV